MIYFFYPILVFSFFLFLDQRKSIVISLICLTIITGLRYNVGGDLVGYDNYYQTTNQIKEYLSGNFAQDTSTIKYYFEFFYTLINSVAKSTNLSVYGVYFISSVLMNSCIYGILIKLNRKIDPLSFLVIYFCSLALLHQMHYIRQGLATLFIIYAYLNYISGNKKSFGILIVAGAGSHIMTSIILLPCIFISKFLNLVAFTLIIFFGLLIYFFKFDLIENLIKILTPVEILIGILENYIEIETASSGNLTITAIFSIFTSIYIILFRRHLYQADKFYRLSSNLIFIYTFFNLIFYNFPIFGRIYFALMIAFPMFWGIEIYKSKYNIYFKFIALYASLFYLYRVFYINESNYELFFPYNFIFLDY